MSTYIEYVHARPEFEELLFQLATANGFTAADLAANRKGRVGRNQLSLHLSEAVFGPTLVLLGCLTISLLVRVTFAGFVEKRSMFDFFTSLVGYLAQLKFDKLHEAYLTTEGHRLPIIVALFVVTAPAFAYRKLRHIDFRLIFSLLRGRVSQAEGLVYTTSEEVKAPGRAGKKGETIEVHYYQVQDKKLRVSGIAFKALAIGIRYRVYYLDGSRTLLSIEPVMSARKLQYNATGAH